MQRIQRLLSTWGAGLALFTAFTLPAQTAPGQPLRGHVPAAVARFHLPPTGRPAATKRLNLAIGLPLRNPQALDDLLREIYDPASPHFHQYLTPEQFTERFGPNEPDYQALAAYLQAKGLVVTATHPNRMVLDVQGPVADIERVFHVTLRNYAHPKESRDFYAPESEPALDLSVAVLQVAGLDNYSLPHPANLRVKKLSERTANATANSGSGPGNSYLARDFRAAYVPGVSLTGSGQSVALLQFDGYVSNDIAAYISQAGLTNYPISLTNVPVNGGVSTPGEGNGEVCLDIEMVISMAPGVSKIYVYEAPNGSTAWSTILSRIANDNLAKQISCSWGGGSADSTSEQIFKQMAAQGQSFFSASGDYDAFSGAVEFPSDSTNITQVGGTTLTTTGPGGPWFLETTWNWGGGFGSAGGISPTYAIPAWQQGISMTTNKGSTTMRNVPDVALTADNIFIIADTNQQEIAAGTSAAAPLWAGFCALVNQQALAGGKTNVGFINPAVYAIGKSNSYASDFNDIVTGNNYWDSSTNKFPAVPGYDLCTGWGTPAGDNLIDGLATVGDALAVAPGRGFAVSGPAGGAFTASAQSFSLTNSGAVSLNWSLINTSLWLAASATNGTLTPGGPATNVVVGLSPAAYNLSTGVYTASVWFTNRTSHAVRTRQFALLVGQQMIQNGGFESGTLSYWAQTGPGNSYSYDAIDDGSVSGISPHSGSWLIAFGMTGSLGYISQTVATVPNQAYLISLWFNSPTVSGGNTPNEFSVSWNETTLFDKANIAAFGWTNMVFIVTATNSSSVLKFGGRMDPWYLGLDDVYLWPIPDPTIRSVVKTNGNNLVLGWNTLSNLVYQVHYSTNLAKTNWVILTTNTATGPVMKHTNAFGSDPWRFYRIRRLP
jgi:hypothetical protein